MPDIRGIHVESAGVYVVLDDVVQSIREYAQSLDDPNAGAAIHELASWLGASSMPAVTAGIRHVTDAAPVEVSSETAETLQNVYRVELYPEPPDDPRPRWHARSVDDQGNILHTTAGSFDYDYVYKDASERWPGKAIYQLTKWADDSVFVEKQELSAALTSPPMRERHSPKRMFPA